MLKYALDIGSYSTRLLSAEVEGPTLKVKGALSLPTRGYFGGVITDSSKLLFTILEILNLFQERFGRRPKKVILNCANPGIKFHHLRESFLREDPEYPITLKELERYRQRVLLENISLEEKEIYLQVAEYKVDEQKGIVNPQKMLAKNLEINLNIITIPMTVYNSFQALISDAGLEMEGMVPEIVAKSNIFLSSEEKLAGTMLLDIGWGTTKIAVFKNGILKGSKIINRDLKAVYDLLKTIYHLDFSQAEEILEESMLTERTQLGIYSRSSLKEISAQDVRRIFQKNIEKILHLVRKFILEERIYHYLGEGIVITGGKILEFSELSKLAFEIFRQPIRIAKENTLSSKEGYSTALGLLKHLSLNNEGSQGLRKKIFSRLGDILERYF